MLLLKFARVLVNVDHIGAKSLRSKLAKIQKSRQQAAEGFDLGSLVHVRGSVVTYNGQREIRASQFGQLSCVQQCCGILVLPTQNYALQNAS